jgi:hypothetical protein
VARIGGAWCAAPIATRYVAGFFLTAEEQTSVSGIAADGYADFPSGGTKLKRN